MDTRSPGWSLGLLAALVTAALVLGLGVAGANASRDASIDASRDEVAHATVQAIAGLHAGVDEARAAAGSVATQVTRAGNPGVVGQVPPSAVINSVAFLVPDASGQAPVSQAAGSISLQEVDLSADAGLQASLALSQDTATTVLTPPVGDAGVVLLLTPMYQIPSGGLSPLPLVAGAEQRRSALSGWLAVEVATHRLVPAAVPTRLDFRVTDGDQVLAGRGGEPPSGHGSGAVRSSIGVAGRTWQVTTWSSVPLGGMPGSGYLMMGGALGLGALMVAGTLRRDRLIARLHQQAENRSRQVTLITELAPVVQHSFELGEVLPAIATRLVDDLGLDGVAFSLPHQGRYRMVFSTGTVSPGQPALTFPNRIEPGESVTLALQRGGRTTGLFHLRAGHALSALELAGAKAAADLAAAAITNAEHFQQQEQVVARLRSVDDLKNVFLGTASHELRTPVTAITGFASLLTTNWDNLSDDDRRLFAGRIHANAGALDQLVQDLLDFSRLERGDLAVAATQVRIGEAVTRVAERLAPVFDHHTLATEIISDRAVMADPNGLDRVLTNLLSNAAKFSPDDTTITLRVLDDTDHVRVIVDDEGPGVPVEEREHIFSRFFRGAGPEVVKTRGAGIGLAVVTEFVEQMHGSIHVGDSPTGGARFELRLAAADEPSHHDDSDTGGTEPPRTTPEEDSHAPDP